MNDSAVESRLHLLHCSHTAASAYRHTAVRTGVNQCLFVCAHVRLSICLWLRIPGQLCVSVFRCAIPEEDGKEHEAGSSMG